MSYVNYDYNAHVTFDIEYAKGMMKAGVTTLGAMRDEQEAVEKDLTILIAKWAEEAALRIPSIKVVVTKDNVKWTD